MRSIKQAFRFIQASFSLALQHAQLQEPWFILGLGSLIVLLIGFIPIAVVVGWIGLKPIGMILIGLLTAMTLVDLLIWGEITSLRTAQAFSAIEEHSSEEPTSHLNNLSRHGFDILTLELIVPMLRFFKWLRSLFRPNISRIDENRQWLEAYPLALPIIALEDLPLRYALARLQQIVKDNLLRFQVRLIPVRLVAILTQITLIAVGILLAFIVGINIAAPMTATPWQRVLAAGISALIAWFPTLIGIIFSSFTRTSYATSLYLWARNVESARQTGNLESAQPPALLRQILGSAAATKDR